MMKRIFCGVALTLMFAVSPVMAGDWTSSHNPMTDWDGNVGFKSNSAKQFELNRLNLREKKDSGYYGQWKNVYDTDIHEGPQYHKHFGDTNVGQQINNTSVGTQCSSDNSGSGSSEVNCVNTGEQDADQEFDDSNVAGDDVNVEDNGYELE